MALLSEKTPKSGLTPPDSVVRIQKLFDEAKRTHDNFVRLYERRERAYRGVLEPRSEAAKWKHQQHPPLAFNLIETIVSNTVEEGLTFTAKPAPKPGLALEEAQFLLAQAQSVENVIRHEHRVDEMDEKQRAFYLCMAIGGVGVLHNYWNYSTGSYSRQKVGKREVRDAYENVIGSVPTIERVNETGVLKDHSTCEVVDPRDFIMHESARTLQPTAPGGAQFVVKRCWYSFEQLQNMERAGFFKNVKYLAETRKMDEEYTDRDTEVFDVDWAKDLVEVLEFWEYKNGQVWRTFVGNRAVELRAEEASPFDHGEYPFVIGSMAPMPFSPRGFSDMELIEQIQEIVWELMNQRLDNVELINNAITLISTDVEDIESFEFFPGAKWQVERTDQVQPYIPPYQLAGVTLEAEALARGDLQNVTAAAPFTSGTETATVDQKTATGASLVMSAAQKRLAYKKYTAQKGLRREADQRLKNCQQFYDTDRLIHVIGKDGAMAFESIGPIQIQGEYLVELEPIGESMNREQKRAEALQLGQVLFEMAPTAMATGTPLNTKEILKWMLEKWDVTDAERFFSAVPQPAMMPGAEGPGGAGGGGGGGGMASTPTGPPGIGVTADSSANILSPSGEGGTSINPSQALARALSMGGGAANA